MNTYKIMYSREQYYAVTVQAADPDEARKLADEQFDQNQHFIASSPVEYTDYEEV
jgi:hypothetical protein